MIIIKYAIHRDHGMPLSRMFHFSGWNFFYRMLDEANTNIPIHVGFFLIFSQFDNFFLIILGFTFLHTFSKYISNVYASVKIAKNIEMAISIGYGLMVHCFGFYDIIKLKSSKFLSGNNN